MIEARNLERSFGGRRAVREVSFRVEPGEIVALLGPNGAGKTTTMRMLVGVLRPEGGEVRVDGPAGYLPEGFRAYDALSVRGYLGFMARMKGVYSPPEVERVMELAGVPDLARRPTGRLSKGQHRRVGIAQALLGSPPVYVLDEPTIGLDPRQVVEARAVFRGLRDAGAAVLLSTHLLAEASAVCDRAVVVARGRVVADEPVTASAELEERFLRLVAEAELAE